MTGDNVVNDGSSNLPGTFLSLTLKTGKYLEKLLGPK